MVLVLTALTLGALHSFAPDHLAAVSVYVSRCPSWRRAMSLGARWGLGHSLTIAVLGGSLAVARLRLPERLAPAAEGVVGLVLVGLGLRTLWRAARIHGHWHEHAGARHWHLHTHGAGDAHDHSHGALLGIGMLHGLAGTGALAAALPATLPRVRALAFLVSFGVGTVVSMALFSAMAGHTLRLATRASAAPLRAVSALAGVASVAVGLWWVATGGA